MQCGDGGGQVPVEDGQAGAALIMALPLGFQHDAGQRRPVSYGFTKT